MTQRSKAEIMFIWTFIQTKKCAYLPWSRVKTKYRVKCQKNAGFQQKEEKTNAITENLRGN